MNSVYGETEITLRGDINAGMAVALEEGLIVPVVRHANQLTMKQLVQESARLAAAARDGTLTPDDLHAGTFTVSALGMFGVDSFTPIINSPQSGILGVNRIRDGVRWEGAKPEQDSGDAPVTHLGPPGARRRARHTIPDRRPRPAGGALPVTGLT